MFRFSFFLMALALIAGNVFAQDWTMEDVSYLLEVQPASAGVVAWGDLNGDGHPDLFVGGDQKDPSTLYIYDQGIYRERTSEYLPEELLKVTKAQFIDYDADGLMDLFLLTNDYAGARLFRQNGETHLMTAVNILGNDSYLTPIRAALWNDVDGNGTLDLIASNGPTVASPVKVFTKELNEFIEMRDNPFEGLTGVGAISFADFNRDGHAEIFFGFGTDPGQSRFYIYDGGTWKDWAQRFEMPARMGSRGAAWLDYNNDGRMDFFCNGDKVTMGLFSGSANGNTPWLHRVTDESISASADGFEVHPVDANLDGWTDLYVVKNNSCILLVNEAGAGWIDKAANLGIDNTNRTNRSAAWADFNSDGTPDLAIAQGSDGVRLFQNNLRIGHEYVAVNLLTPTTHVPVLNCNVTMLWRENKQIVSTFPSTCAAGQDGSTLLLVSCSTEKSDRVDLQVDWPNGFTTHYNWDQLNKRALTNLYMPSISDVPVTAAPSAPLLSQVNQTVSPNPFNPTTTISFNLPEATNVELKVYNLAGQEVATLVSGSLTSGSHRVEFDAHALPSGLYFSRLTANGMSSMTRMLLMK